MIGFLLDTNVISEYSRARPPNERVRRWVDRQKEDLLYLSVLTLGEIRKGIELLPQSRRRRDLERWLDVEVPARFQRRIVPVGGDIAQLWGSMTAQARRTGATLPIIDSLIAATAVHHKLTLVTRNVKDFKGLGTPILNPWE